MKKKILYSVIICFLVLINSGCGLPTYLYLYSPSDFFKSSESQLALEHNISNYDSSEGSDQSFKGYEIYYRVYDSSTAAQSDIDSLVSMASNYEGYPDSFMTYATSSLDFVRLRSVSSNESPVISISNPSDSAVFYVNLNDGAEWSLNDGDNSILSYLARSITSDFSTRGSFFTSSNYESGDDDYEGSDAPAAIYFAFYTVAFGSDPETFETVYSDPVIIDSYLSYTPR
ncbi:MAG TPA: hypothetical protein VN445_03795 [Rectinemataceae bacterium]|nr:hypothetical protein [Rectinemataceae bacterium]